MEAERDPDGQVDAGDGFGGEVLGGEEDQVGGTAAGMSNKEIGQRLFLSHRTVGAHLYQIFPKLGIRSRAALRDALAELPEPLYARSQ